MRGWMIKMYVVRSASSSYLLCPAVLGGSWKRGCSEGLPTVAVEDCGEKRRKVEESEEGIQVGKGGKQGGSVERNRKGGR